MSAATELNIKIRYCRDTVVPWQYRISNVN
jgi:hypothetical protein